MNKILLTAVLSLFAFAAQADNKWADAAEHIHNAFHGSGTLTSAIEAIAMPSQDPNDKPDAETQAVIDQMTSTCTITLKQTPRGGTAEISGGTCAAPSVGSMTITQANSKVVKGNYRVTSNVMDAGLQASLHIANLNISMAFTQTTNGKIQDSNVTQKGAITSDKLGRVPFTFVIKSHNVDGDDTKNVLNLNQTFNVGKARGNVWVNFANDNMTCAIDGQKASGGDCLAALYLMGVDFNSVKKLVHFKL